MSTSRTPWSALRSQLAREPKVTALGLFGIALGGGCVLLGLLGGFQVPPEGNLWEAAKFDAAVGIFLVTQAALAPEAGFSTTGRRWWGNLLVGATLFGYGMETVQALRGLDPRFSTVAGPVDQALGGVFFLDALFIMVLFIALAWRFFVADATPLRLAVRYATAACLVSFGVGIWMSVNQGRMLGDGGNLMPIHAAGFHGLQAIPLVAVFLGWGGVSDRMAERWVHLAGLAWSGLCVALVWQAGAGWGPLDVTPATLAGLAFFGGWATVAVVAVRSWTRPLAV